MIWRALRLRCPRCGGGGVARGFHLAERCPRCGHRYERHEGYWIGAVAVNTVVTIAVFGAVLIGATVATWPDPPWGAITIAGVATTIVFPIIFYPWSRLLWVALDLRLHPPEG